MVPLPYPSPQEPHFRKPNAPPTLSPTTKTSPTTRHHRKTSLLSLLNSLHHHLHLHRTRTCIFFSLLFLFQLLLLAALRFFPNSLPLLPSSHSSPSHSCPLGKVYVYDLPSAFNSELIQDCRGIIPSKNVSSTRCHALLNDGFGRRAEEMWWIVPWGLASAWYWTDQFVLEIVFHRRILGHQCRTFDPSNATAFYVPFYAGIAVGRYLWSDNYTASDRDRHCRMMLGWLNEQPYYRRSKGWDHFLAMGRITWDFRRSKDGDWGSSCIKMAGMRNLTRLIIERNPWDYFDVGVPYPTGFHPRTERDLVRWQDFVRNRDRTKLFCFAGGKRVKNDFRALLFSHCQSQPSLCRVVDCTGMKCVDGNSLVIEAFLDSDFCLQPRGDSFTRRSIFDCMLAGSIPVLFWKRSASYQYQWFLPGEPDNYSVFIDRNAVKNTTVSIAEVLVKYSREEVKKMRERVIEYIPRIIYTGPNEGLGTVRDAFDIALDGVLKRFKEQEESGFTRW